MKQLTGMLLQIHDIDQLKGEGKFLESVPIARLEIFRFGDTRYLHP